MEFLKEPSQEPVTLTSSTDPGLSQIGWWNSGMLVKSLAGPEAAALHHSRQFVIGSIGCLFCNPHMPMHTIYRLPKCGPQALGYT